MISIWVCLNLKSKASSEIRLMLALTLLETCYTNTSPETRALGESNAPEKPDGKPEGKELLKFQNGRLLTKFWGCFFRITLKLRGWKS